MGIAEFPGGGTPVAMLAGRVALVTGGTRGIGLAISRELASAGAFVFMNYTSNDAVAREAAESLSSDRALAVRADISDLAAVEKMFATVERELAAKGLPPRLDILVNNAGIGCWGSIQTASLDDFDRALAVNLRGTFLVTRTALRYVPDGGRIINISSGASRRPAVQFAGYAMTKAAIDHLTLSLAAELGPRRITVNAIAPGWTATEINAAARKQPEVAQKVIARTALGRLGQPEDVAAVALFLASDLGRWVTGQYLEASGGLGLVG
jgi:3-oxoacyl-[acyl-carrier protein] reductase